MKRLLALIAAIAVALALAGPALGAEGDMPHTGRVVLATQGDVTIPAGEQADAVIVFTGTATIRGAVNAVVVFGGEAVLEGATVEALFVTDGSARIDAASTVLGDVRTFDATVDAAPGAVKGTVRGLEMDVAAATVFMAPALGLLYVGLTVSLVLAGLVVAALAGRQVRQATGLIRSDLAPTIGAGLVGLIAPPFLAFLLAVTLVGIPAALALLVIVWPTIAFIGYLVAGIWLGELVLGRSGVARDGERPYLAAIVGLVVLQVVGIIPLVGPILGFLGFGAVLLAAWRVFRQGRIDRAVVPAGVGSPMPA
jgi:hypothetical protein